MSAEPSEQETVHAAVDTLLLVVEKSADDLRHFHDALKRLRTEGPTPFPRVAVSTVESIVEHLTKVEDKLREATVALGL